MDAGQSAADKAAAASRAAAHLRQKAADAEAAAARYQQGFEGERLLAEWLTPLQAAGFRLLADCTVPGAVGNIDMIAVGPAGVFVIDAKNWSGRLEIRQTDLLQSGRPRPEAVDGVVGQAAVVDAALRAAGAGTVQIWPILAFVGEASIPGYRLLDRIYITGGPAVSDLLQSAAPVLDQPWIDWTHAVLASALPPRTSVLHGAVQQPEEHVVFLNPWFKNGNRRIYVRDELGTDGGYLDLVSGRISGHSPAAAQVLGQLLPHYLSDLDSAGLDVGDQRGIRTFLADSGQSNPTVMPLVAGNVWRRHGLQRLYVSRLTSDGRRLEMGWYDLDDGRVYSDSGLEAEVRYCGETFEKLEADRVARQNGSY
jgi:hypothetical protein